MILIGLSGYAGSGKDTAAETLLEIGFERKAFADKLRAFLYALNPVVGTTTNIRLQEIVDFVGWDMAKRGHSEIRKLLQRCGTEAGRKILGENVWVDATLSEMTRSGAYVITDVRFENEAHAIADAGGYVFRVERPGVGPATDEDGNVHESEIALDDYAGFDSVIVNDGTATDLHEKVMMLLRSCAEWDDDLGALLRVLTAA